MTPFSSLDTIKSDGLRSWQDADEYTRSRLFEFTVEHANDPVIITTTELSSPGPHIVYVNRAFTRLSGYSAEEAIGQTPRLLQGPLTNRAEMARMRAALERGQTFVGETINYRKDGSTYHMEWSVHGLFDDQGTLHFYVAVQRDISARKEFEYRIREQTRELAQANAQLAYANERLVALSLTDSLTGLANHRAFHTRLKEELERARRYGYPLSLLLLDVDRFKAYNDTFGHPEGDTALQQVALLLQTHARANDLVARHGGEEFAVLLPETEREEALRLAEVMRAQVEAYPWPHRPITISIGIATTSPRDAYSLPLIPYADEALYNSKSTGRNRIT